MKNGRIIVIVWENEATNDLKFAKLGIKYPTIANT